MKRKYIKASRCSIIAMCDGRGEEDHSVVIQDGRRMRYVGIGWVDEGPATERDYKEFKVVKG